MQEFKILLHHCHNGSKKTYKVWIYKSVSKLKRVGHQKKIKNEGLKDSHVEYLQHTPFL